MLPRTAAQPDSVVTIPPLQVLDSRPTGAFGAISTSKVFGGALGQQVLDVTSLSPNFSYSSAGPGSFGAIVSARGLSNTPYFGEPSLAWYVDDLPLTTIAAMPTLIPGLDSVDWLRGPQAGFSLGRSGPAGTAMMRTLSPTPGRGQLRIGMGSRSRVVADARVDARTGSLDARAALAYHREDGYVHNRSLGQSVGDVDHRGVNARVRVRLGGSADATLQVLGTQARDGAQPLVPLRETGLGYYEVERDSEGRTETDFGGAVLSMRATGSFGVLASHTSVVDWKLSPYVNSLALPPLLTSTLSQEQRAYSQELRWQAGELLEFPFTAGVWWSDSRTRGAVDRQLFGTVPLENSSFEMRRQTTAAYAQSVLMSEEGWSLEGGFRVERQRTDFGRIQSVPQPDGFRRGRQKTRYLPKLALTIPVTAKSHLLVIASEAYKPEGYSAYTDNRRLAPFQAERVRSGEVWWEWTPSSNLSLATRAFRYDIRNYQIERSFTATDYLVVNAPRARSTGAEVEAVARLAPSIWLRGGFGWQEVKLLRFTDPFTGIAHDGNVAPYAPGFTGRVEGEIRLLGGLTLFAEARRTGTTYFTEDENVLYRQREYTVVSAALVWEFRGWTVTARGSNLLEEKYRTLIVPGIDHAVPGAPRTLSVEVGLRF
ncbi:MAG: TonB-dependent receptor [Opitutaceae bacterium]|nr:TonB-dependent receptor [Opitutaceae bacterium]